MTYTILENGKYLVEILDSNQVPMLIEMTFDEFVTTYGNII